VVYSMLTSIIVIVLFVPRIRRGTEVEMTKEWLRAVGVCLALWNMTLILGSSILYCLYAYVDLQIQQLVRQLMDETGIGAPCQQNPTMHRDDSNQHAFFELPEFINILWQRASRTSSQYDVESFAPSPSDQISSIDSV
jgi:hypothetical protein